MDAVSVVIGAFLQISIACTALPADEYTIAGDDYLVMNWNCHVDQRTHQTEHWRSWQRRCHNASHTETYWSRPYYLLNTTTQMAFYMNQFGEIHAGQGARLLDAYVPKCGT